MSSQMILRVPDDLKEKVGRQAKAEGKNVSTLVREVLEEYIRNRDMSSHVDDLWGRIGRNLKARGKGSENIESGIRLVRAKK
ncbi:MAG: ribbon-helix-helix protein, CopG family [Thermodesulfobacteriota bacterium]